ncbi:unnamed protein product [Arabis nemorensis]|uniref:Peptidase C14 caspase domain-containing protein n=1 Tax=Arabis nemorensis TaxID=586526 RepID=A0A565AQ42_9BRAS|nr:unnamed protein product [Arabis nemorensis]
MAKQAVLVGINYPGTAEELRGCVNDVLRMRKCLIDRFGFSSQGIKLLIDTDKSYVQPTGKNIREALKTLISEGKSGDVLVFYYCGHGTRIPSADDTKDATKFDECITPCDMNLITDNDFRDMLSEVKTGCRLTIISDSCHSGGLIEAVKEQIGDSHVNPPKSGIANFFSSIVMRLLGACGMSSSRIERGSGQESFTKKIELEDGEIIEAKKRYLPLDSYVTLLAEQTGQTNIKYRDIRPTLVKFFGEDSSPSMTLANSTKRNGHRGLVSMLRSIGEVNSDGAGTGAQSLYMDKAVMLSGCQTDEKSEDVYVTRTRKAYGAFSDTIQKILSERRKDKKISNKKIVLKARDILKRQGYSQEPGLYCHDRYVNEPFIC